MKNNNQESTIFVYCMLTRVLEVKEVAGGGLEAACGGLEAAGGGLEATGGDDVFLCLFFFVVKPSFCVMIINNNHGSMRIVCQW